MYYAPRSLILERCTNGQPSAWPRRRSEYKMNSAIAAATRTGLDRTRLPRAVILAPRPVSMCSCLRIAGIPDLTTEQSDHIQMAVQFLHDIEKLVDKRKAAPDLKFNSALNEHTDRLATLLNELCPRG